jgi:hypothetical protein
MNKLISLIVALTVIFPFGTAFADSSGSFSATGGGVTCTATPATYDPITGIWSYPTCSPGQITPGPNPGTLCGGYPLTAGSSFTTTLQTSNGQGVALLVRPSAVTGLFTDTKISTSVPSSTADIGIQVCVSSKNVKTGSPDTVYPITGVDKNGNNISCVVYDQRIQQISSQLFSQLSECTTTTACGPALPACPANQTCSDPVNGGVCLNNLCNLELLQTTLSAHNYDFVIPITTQGSHQVTMYWQLIGQGQTTAGGNVQACLGPAEVTVQQVKNFSNNAPINLNCTVVNGQVSCN